MAFQLCRGMDDAPPWRPPSSMLALLASEQFSDKDVVDLRPTVGAASCYPRLARSVTALSHSDNASFCEELEAHASTVARRTKDALASSAFSERPFNYSARCGVDFHQRGNSLPDADVYIWWQQQVSCRDSHTTHNHAHAYRIAHP